MFKFKPEYPKFGGKRIVKIPKNTNIGRATILD